MPRVRPIRRDARELRSIDEIAAALGQYKQSIAALLYINQLNRDSIATADSKIAALGSYGLYDPPRLVYGERNWNRKPFYRSNIHCNLGALDSVAIFVHNTTVEDDPRIAPECVK